MKAWLTVLAILAIGFTGVIYAQQAPYSVPYYFSTAPNAYVGGPFPSNALNSNFNYLTPQAWQVITTSGVAAAGNNLAVNTTSAAITVTLPPPVNSFPLNSIKLLDAANTFNTHNLTVNASGIAPINGLSGASAVVTGATAGEEITCTYLNSASGYNCNQR